MPFRMILQITIKKIITQELVKNKRKGTKILNNNNNNNLQNKVKTKRKTQKILKTMNKNLMNTTSQFLLRTSY
jgi:hypothetical protein